MVYLLLIISRLNHHRVQSTKDLRDDLGNLLTIPRWQRRPRGLKRVRCLWGDPAGEPESPALYRDLERYQSQNVVNIADFLTYDQLSKSVFIAYDCRLLGRVIS